MKCLIIAAGKGTRLSPRGLSKPLVPLLGVPLIERVIRTAASSGVSRFYVVTGYHGEEVRLFLNQVASGANLQITPVANEEWEKGNGLSVLKARKWLDEDFILLMADHLFDAEILRKVQGEPLPAGEVRLAVDYGLQTNQRVDLDDVTRVLTRDGKIVDIGKGIQSYNAYDTGIFLSSPVIFQAIETCFSTLGDSSLSGAIKLLAGQGKVRPFDIGDRFWMDIDDEKALCAAAEIIPPRDDLLKH